MRLTKQPMLSDLPVFLSVKEGLGCSTRSLPASDIKIGPVIPVLLQPQLIPQFSEFRNKQIRLSIPRHKELGPRLNPSHVNLHVAPHSHTPILASLVQTVKRSHHRRRPATYLHHSASPIISTLFQNRQACVGPWRYCWGYPHPWERAMLSRMAAIMELGEKCLNRVAGRWRSYMISLIRLY
jgi:hypothetical protein